MSAGENMVFVGGDIKAGGNARLSAGGDLLLLAYDTGKQLRGAPMTPIRFFLDNGHLTNRGADTLGLTGVGILWVTAYLIDEWSGIWFWFFLLLGGVLGYIGAYGGLAKRFGFSAPFTNDPVGWRAAKKSYDEPESKEDDSNNQ